MIFHSLRWRLQIWYGLILLAVLLGFGITAYQLESGRLWGRFDGDLQRRASLLGGALRGPNFRERNPNDRPRPPRQEMDALEPRPNRPPRLEPGEGDGEPRREFGGRPGPEFRLEPHQAAFFDDADTNGFYFVVWHRDGSILARSSNAPLEVPMPDRSERGPRPPRTRMSWREAFVITPPGEIILVGRTMMAERAELRRVALKLTGAGAVILVLGIAGGWWLVTRAIRPIRDISATALKISGGDLSQRINLAETDSELGHLAAVLNSTFSRLDKAFTQQQQFTSDAAHELRTPVSVMLTQTQMSLNRERNAAEYRSTIEACQRAAQRMRRLIESLMQLARLDAGQETMRTDAVDLAHVAGEAMEWIQSLAAERGIRIETELESAPCRGDGERLGQVLTNLLTNAVQYNVEGGCVRIRTCQEGDWSALSVSDDGPGIAAEHLPRIFERFYRVDDARTSARGHAGLGLAISKAIVDAHGGRIEVSSDAGKGASFVVRLPAADKAQG